MSYKRLRTYLLLPFWLLVICLAFAGVLWRYNHTLSIAQFAIAAAVADYCAQANAN